jgi:hypothetical protein
MMIQLGFFRAGRAEWTIAIEAAMTGVSGMTLACGHGGGLESLNELLLAGWILVDQQSRMSAIGGPPTSRGKGDGETKLSGKSLWYDAI